MPKRESLNGKPDAGNPHVRFDDEETALAATPRRGSLLYKTKTILAAMMAAVAVGAALPSFAAAKSVTLSATGYTGTEAIANFQMLVKLSEGVYGYSYADSESDGSDIWFEDSAGNVIQSEIDTWNADGESFVWVKVPSLSPVSSGATSIVMHWGDLASKRTTSDKMWTGFAGVWHMGNVSGTTKEPDKTGNGLDAQPQTSANSSSTASATTMNTASGVVGKSRITAHQRTTRIRSLFPTTRRQLPTHPYSL